MVMTVMVTMLMVMVMTMAKMTLNDNIGEDNRHHKHYLVVD